MKAFFNCHGCGLEAKSFPAPERERNETVEHYLNTLARRASVIHSLVSPSCRAKKFDLALPITQNGIGFQGPELTEADKADLREQLKK